MIDHWSLKGAKLVEEYIICTHSQSAEVNRIAVRAIASLIASSDLEGVNGAWGQSRHGHCVGLSEHTGCTALIRALQRERGIGFVLLVKRIQHILCIKQLKNNKR